MGKSSVAEPLATAHPGSRTERRYVTRRNAVGLVSLLVALGGTIGCHVALASGTFAEAPWLHILGTGFEAALVGGLADWFAVTALFRHPLGLPIPHTAIIPARRAKIIESITSIIQEEWLSPAVIHARLARLSPSTLITDWLRDRAHMARLASPVRDVVCRLVHILAEDEVARFLDRTLRELLWERGTSASLGPWLYRIASSESADEAFATVAKWLAGLTASPEVAAGLYWSLARLSHTLHADGQRLLAFFLRRPIVQQKIVEAISQYATAELTRASQDPHHPWRTAVRHALREFAERLAAGEPEAVAQAERIRDTLVTSAADTPLVRPLLVGVVSHLERELGEPASALSTLLARTLQTSLLEWFASLEHSATFDHWVRSTADELVERYHHEIGVTVRENLDALDTGDLVDQIEARIGPDLQFIRLNGAVVGGLIGLLLGLVHWLTR